MRGAAPNEAGYARSTGDPVARAAWSCLAIGAYRRLTGEQQSAPSVVGGEKKARVGSIQNRLRSPLFALSVTVHTTKNDTRNDRRSGWLCPWLARATAGFARRTHLESVARIWAVLPFELPRIRMRTSTQIYPPARSVRSSASFADRSAPRPPPSRAV